MQKKPTKNIFAYIIGHVYFITGCTMLVLAFIGALLPIMPTVPFLIAAAWFFSRSSPRFKNWLYTHRLFGPPILRWEEKGAINPVAKMAAVGGMASGFIVFCAMVTPSTGLMAIIANVLLCCAVYILSRPSQ